MTLTELKAWVRHLLFERSTTSGLMTDSELDTHIQIAYRRLYNLLVKRAPLKFATYTSDLSITSSGISLTNTAVVPAHLEIVRVDIKDGSGNYIVIKPVNPNEVPQLFGPSASFGEWSVADYNWTIIGQKLYLVGPPINTQTIRVYYAPEPTTLTTTMTPFLGRFASFHDVVAIEAAHQLATMDQKASLFAELRKERVGEFVDHVSRMNAQQPSAVKITEFEDV